MRAPSCGVISKPGVPWPAALNGVTPPADAATVLAEVEGGTGKPLVPAVRAVPTGKCMAGVVAAAEAVLAPAARLRAGAAAACARRKVICAQSDHSEAIPFCNLHITDMLFRV